MGCGASAQCHVPPKEETAEDSANPADGTWATKTNPDNVGAVGSDVQLFTPSAKGVPPKGVSTLAASKKDQNMMVLDAEENDEIEIIYEAPSRQPAAANGQEPPEAAEPDVRQPEPKPLSRQQQEEAAKLAERRKRFDNQRYQREQRAGHTPAGYPTDVIPFDVIGSVPPGPIRPELASSKPVTDMMLGLNVTEVANKESRDLHGVAFLPGGIFDDDDDFKMAPQTKSRQQQHDDVKSSGFDDDDEKLMKEILENFDAV